MAKSGSKRKVLVECHGEAYIVASFNNIIISPTNKNGDVISWSSAGKMGFKEQKKIRLMLLKWLLKMRLLLLGMRSKKLCFERSWNGRESAIRSIHNGGIEVTEIVDVTPTPHNGCRPPKRRRV